MRLLGLNILTDKKYVQLTCDWVKTGHEYGIKMAKTYYRRVFESELLRLKKDHWDKQAFECLLELIKEEKEK